MFRHLNYLLEKTITLQLLLISWSLDNNLLVQRIILRFVLWNKFIFVPQIRIKTIFKQATKNQQRSINLLTDNLTMNQQQYIFINSLKIFFIQKMLLLMKWNWIKKIKSPPNKKSKSLYLSNQLISEINILLQTICKCIIQLTGLM